MNGNTYTTCIPDDQARAQGQAILRVARDLRHALPADADLPADFWNDLATMEVAGRQLAAASMIPLTKPGSLPAASGLLMSATGLPVTGA